MNDLIRRGKEYCAECDHVEMCQWYPNEGCEFRSLPSAQTENTILKAINNIRALTGCEELIITDKDSMRTWDANGVEYKLYPERKKGEWLEVEDWNGDFYYECSECKEPFTLFDGTPQDNLYNFCPNCGADMKGEEECTKAQ